MKGRYKGTSKENIDKVFNDRIERSTEKLKKYPPLTFAQYEFFLKSELSWIKKDRGRRKFIAMLLLGIKIITEKIKKNVEPRVKEEIEEAIELLEDHVRPNRLSYELFLYGRLCRIGYEKLRIKIVAMPLP